MTSEQTRIGLIGGTGMLGTAIARALLARKAVAAADLWISGRSAQTPTHGPMAGVNSTQDNQALVAACDVILLCVPPAELVNLRIDAGDRLVVSVMAGVPIDRLRQATGARRVVRAMSSPAAGLGLAYSPWTASAEVGAQDRATVHRLFAACGLTDEVTDEAQIDFFTALTGPVPGFVAFFAASMADHAVKSGIAPQIADRAVRQLFRASGEMMAQGTATPGDHVREMIDYAGTTAAGLTAMQDAALPETIAAGLDAATAMARRMG